MSAYSADSGIWKRRLDGAFIATRQAGARAWSIAKDVCTKADQDALGSRASALAFQALFAIVPLIAMGYFVFSIVKGFDEMRGKVQDFLVTYLAPAAADQMNAYLAEIQSAVSPATVGIFGVLAFLYSCISMVGLTETSLNAIWGVPTTRSLWKRVVYYAGAVIAGPVCIGGSLAAASFLAAQVRAYPLFPAAAASALTLTPLLTTGLFFAVIYRFLPHTKVTWRSALIAGFVVGATSEALKSAYGLYAAYSLGKSVYGSLAALPILFLWFSLAATIFLWGAELCYFLDQKRAGIFHVALVGASLSPPMLKDLVALFARARDEGRSRLPLSEVVGSLKWDQSVVLGHLHFLDEAKVLRATAGDEEQCFAFVDSTLQQGLERTVAAINRVQYAPWRIDGDTIVPCAQDASATEDQSARDSVVCETPAKLAELNSTPRSRVSSGIKGGAPEAVL